MPEDQQKPHRLAGICKKCLQLRFGYLVYGRGPFICYECAEAVAVAKRIPATTTTTNTPGALYFSYTFTTSNSTSSNWPDFQGFHD